MSAVIRRFSSHTLHIFAILAAFLSRSTFGYAQTSAAQSQVRFPETATGIATIQRGIPQVDYPIWPKRPGDTLRSAGGFTYLPPYAVVGSANYDRTRKTCSFTLLAALSIEEKRDAVQRIRSYYVGKGELDDEVKRVVTEDTLEPYPISSMEVHVRSPQPTKADLVAKIDIDGLGVMPRIPLEFPIPDERDDLVNALEKDPSTVTVCIVMGYKERGFDQIALNAQVVQQVTKDSVEQLFGPAQSQALVSRVGSQSLQGKLVQASSVNGVVPEGFAGTNTAKLIEQYINGLNEFFNESTKTSLTFADLSRIEEQAFAVSIDGIRVDVGADYVRGLRKTFEKKSQYDTQFDTEWDKVEQLLKESENEDDFLRKYKMHIEGAASGSYIGVFDADISASSDKETLLQTHAAAAKKLWDNHVNKGNLKDGIKSRAYERMTGNQYTNQVEAKGLNLYLIRRVDLNRTITRSLSLFLPVDVQRDAVPRTFAFGLKSPQDEAVWRRLRFLEQFVGFPKDWSPERSSQTNGVQK